MDHKTKILYISYYFPPLGGVASIRALKMVKYLERLGISSTVVSLNPCGLRYPIDKTLLAEIPKHTIVHRFKTIDITWLYKIFYGLRLHKLVQFLSQRVFIPDQFIISLHNAQRTVKHILTNKNDIRCVVISSGPPSSLLLGPFIKTNFGIPYIIDFRDEWTNNHERVNNYYPKVSLLKELAMEALVINEATALSFVTEVMRDNFVSKHPQCSSKNYRIIYNGYDEDDFIDYHPQHSFNKLHILFTGSFYGRYKPEPLLTAMVQLHNEGLINEDMVSFEIIGHNRLGHILGKYKNNTFINKVVSVIDFKPHTEVIRVIANSSVLLLVIPSGVNADSVVTGKLFDYLRSMKPIFGLIPERGLARKIIDQAGIGFCCEFEDIDCIKKTVMKLIQIIVINKQNVETSSLEYVSQYSRLNQSCKLYDMILEIVNENK